MKTLTPRPTTYKGTTMRSRLEAGFAQWLDQMGWKWQYEPECFAGPSGQWLPDFLIHQPCLTLDWPGGNDDVHLSYEVYIEVKPSTFSAEDRRSLIPRITSLYLTNPDAVAVIAQDGSTPTVIHPDGSHAPLDWTWTGLWPIDARRVAGPWQGEWWKGVAG
jgi:hypothetical protein